MRWFKRTPTSVPPELVELEERVAESEKYVAEQEQAAGQRWAEIRRNAVWLEWRRGTNHLSMTLFNEGGRPR